MRTLPQIEGAIRASWGRDTADKDDGWRPENPSRGQCDVTSLVVQDIFGGELLAAVVVMPCSTASSVDAPRSYASRTRLRMNT